MKLTGSCHCGAVTFSVETPEAVPYLRCYCSICRKTAGSGGYGINIGARTDTLVVKGEDHIRRYHPATGETGTGATGASGRRFCGRCGSPLWNFDDRWPDFIHPHAGAIDGDLPVPPEHTHMMLGSAANWAEPHICDGDKTFEEYPDETLADWHKRIGPST
ncbi:MAG: GFA family protein [Hyphomicrobiaceae bacterium]